MSSCAASCFTCSRPALCAFATSASSPIASALRFCLSASACSSPYQKPQRHPLPVLATKLTHSGTAPSAVEPCRLSNGFQRHSSYSDPRLIPAGGQHESSSPDFNPPRAPDTHTPGVSQLARRPPFLDIPPN